MSINKRIATLISTLEETPASFSEKLGIQRSSLSHILSARNKPSVDFLEKLLAVYPSVNITWLLTGKGNVMATRAESQKNMGNVHENEPGEFKLLDSSKLTDKQYSANKNIEKIVWFYKDGSFEVYHPGA